MHVLLSLIILSNCLLTIDKTEGERIVRINQMEYFEDETATFTFHEVLRNSQWFEKNEDFIPTDYRAKSAYWIRLSFCIEDDAQYLVEFYDQTIDNLDVYLQKENGQFESYQFGDHYEFATKNVQHKNFLFTLDGRGQYRLFARVKSQNYADIRLSIKTVNHFIRYSTHEYFLYGIFYGMILIISLYNTTTYGAIGEIKYLHYTFYILSVGLFAMCMDGIAFQFIWPSYPEWNKVAHGIALYSVILWTVIFAMEFLTLRSRVPMLHKTLLGVLILRTCFFIYSLIFDHSLFNYRSVEIIPLLLIFIGSILVFRKGYKPARFFVVAYGFLFVGFIVKALVISSIIPVHLLSENRALQTLTYYSLHLSFVFEMLFLSIALSDRVRILKVNKDKAQDRVIKQHEVSLRYKDILNRKLEQLIQDRTKEITEKNEMLLDANEQLEIQKKEISEINTLLDLDNYKLRNNIQVILKERILNKELSYEDFKSLFHDEEEIIKALAENKWAEGYKCRKCKNKKFGSGQTAWSRRCSKCGYQESPTTNTLFHKLKFPLIKALYIFYDSMNENTYSLSELSQLIDLRKNTIWSFKKKIDALSGEERKGLYQVFDQIHDFV
ncbi:MAG: 7TM diverse intracellular signaling domain-containing protein [Cyclobacteriaceae bacterium]